MATLATIFDKFTWARTREEATPRVRAAENGEYVLRSIPNDDIYIFVKPIDNSRVAREADPAATRACWRAFGTVVAGAALVVGLLAPSLYGMLSGYRLEALRQERQQLQVRMATLDLQETTLRGPQHMADLAGTRQLVEAAPERVVYLEDKDRKLAQR